MSSEAYELEVGNQELAKVPLLTDPVLITVQEDKLRIGSSVILVDWCGNQS